MRSINSKITILFAARPPPPAPQYEDASNHSVIQSQEAGGEAIVLMSLAAEVVGEDARKDNFLSEARVIR